MKIGIIGGNGKTGSAVYAEAKKRGQEPLPLFNEAHGRGFRR